MIQNVKGNILDADVEAIVNTVNCVGIMGKGIALQFKQAYPANYQAYKKACDSGEVRIGKLFVFHTGSMMNPKYIINFPTKRHWKAKSKLKDIESGLEALVGEVGRLNISSLAIPPLGSGSGGLKWLIVKPVIENALSNMPNVDVRLYAPRGAPAAERMPVRTEKPKLTVARALLVKLIELYRVPGYKLSMLEVQKLAYFLQGAGENLRLNFVKHRYGPYAEQLNFVLQRVEGHFTRGYGDRSRDAQITLIPGSTSLADKFLAGNERAYERLHRVKQLIEGLETPYGMELLATVLWIARENPASALDLSRVVSKVYDWSPRKRKMFKQDHIHFAWQRLRDFNWFLSDLSQ